MGNARTLLETNILIRLQIEILRDGVADLGRSFRRQFVTLTEDTLQDGSLGFRVEGPYMGVVYLGKAAITFQVKIDALE